MWKRQTVCPHCFHSHCLRFSQENSLNAFDFTWPPSNWHTRSRTSCLDNLSMGKGEKGRQDPLLGCYHTENSYNQSCQCTYRCVNTPHSSSPKQLPISFEQTLSEWKIFVVSHYLRRIGINSMSKLRTQPNTALLSIEHHTFGTQ